jgi:SAM-dependent methyltransferase
MSLIWIVCGIILLFGFVVLRGAPYVPSKRRLLDKAFDELYPISDKDVLVDIGCGDGVVLRAAAARGARAVGYELNPALVIIAKILSRDKRISIRLADFWFVTLPADTTIVYTFGESRDIKKMYALAQKTAKQNNRQIYFMSFGFPVPDVTLYKKNTSFYLYKVRP